MPLFPPNIEKMAQACDAAGLVKCLAEGSWPRRDAARNALIACGAPAVEPLMAALRHPTAWVRRNAAAALGAIGDRRAVEALMLAVRDPDWHVCLHAVASLGQLRDARAAPALIDSLALLDERQAEDPIRGAGRPESVFAIARQGLVGIGAPAVEPLIGAKILNSGAHCLVAR